MDRTLPCEGRNAGSIPAVSTRKEKPKSFGSLRSATNWYSILEEKFLHCNINIATPSSHKEIVNN